MKKKIISVIKYALFLVAGIGMLWLTFRNQDFTQVIQKIENVHIGWLLASVVAAILAHLSRAIRWNMLITPLGYKPKLINTFWALCAGYFANLAVNPRCDYFCTSVTFCDYAARICNVFLSKRIVMDS